MGDIEPPTALNIVTSDHERPASERRSRPFFFVPTTAAIAASLGLDDRAPSTTRPILYKELSYAVTGAAIAVHRHLGPGQLESTYERAITRVVR